MWITSIDPGTTESAILTWGIKEKRASGALIASNKAILNSIRKGLWTENYVCEMIASYGMPVGKEVFETVLWIGQFKEAAESRGGTFELVTRQQVKLHHCMSNKAKDSNVSQALKDKYGQVGSKNKPGPLYGIKSHLWSALAVATYWSETHK